jgi:phosphoglucosamine mutase
LVALKFGTDGVRGVANVDLTPELVLALGRAAARVLSDSDHVPAFLIGRDTRVSGPLLLAALSAGVASEGLEVRDLGVVPTPAVAALSAAEGLPGAMISASHNPYRDNGIKLFAPGGRKLTDDAEQRLEGELAAIVERPRPLSPAGPSGTRVGRVCPDPDGVRRYEAVLLSSLEGRRLGGLRVVLDCANGAASVTAADVFRRAGAAVVGVLGASPDGMNINDGCGSTAPELLQQSVLRDHADVGLAFDGDADRVIAVDQHGGLIDGDQLLAIFALDLRARGALVENTLVVTVMANMGLRRAMAEHGIRVAETQVGDRYVLETLERGGWSLGGEQSGHLIFPRLATTGDGVLTGLLLLDVMARRGQPLAELAAAAMTRLPQVLRNVSVARRDGLETAGDVWAEVARVEAALGGQGRVLLRPSGTEPLIRIMVEAPTEPEADDAAARLVEVVSRSLGHPPS